MSTYYWFFVWLLYHQTNNVDMFENVNWTNRHATCNCPNIQTRLQKQNCISWHDNHMFIWHTTLVTIKTTIKTIVQHYGLFLYYFQCKCVFLRWIFIFAINWPWNFKVMTPFDRSCSKTYVQKPILWKPLEYVPKYFTFSNFLLWQWLPWKQAIFSKCSMMPAWHHSDSWCGRTWDA